MPNENALDDWENRHRVAMKSARGVESAAAMPLLVRLASPLPAGRALDLACGLGRNSLWLAERGWQVTAVDRSEVAIAAVKEVANRRRLPITAIVANLESPEFVIEPDAWDLIVICNYFQPDLYAPALRGLVPGGLLIASALLASMNEPKKRFRVRPGELPTYFEGSEIIHYREDQGETANEAHHTAEIAVKRRS